MEICFVTTNPCKFEEAKMILGLPLRHANIDVPEIQSLDVKKVAEDKARKAYEILKRPVIAEDTGLYLKGWKGFPGAFIAWVVDTMGTQKFCSITKGQDVTAIACVAFYDGSAAKTFTGRVRGKISDRPKGRKRFDWDRIFIPTGEARTFAQMKLSEKNRISHRTKAFRRLKKYLALYESAKERPSLQGQKPPINF